VCKEVCELRPRIARLWSATDTQSVVRHTKGSGQASPAACQAAVIQTYLGTLLVTVPTVVTVSVTTFVTAPHVRSTEEEMNSQSARIT